MIDISQKIYDWLTADNGTTLYGLVATRIYDPIPPKDYVNTQAALRYRVEMPKSHVSGATHMVQVVFICYGGSQSHTDAETVARALWDRMMAANANNIMKVEFIGGGRMLPEPDTQWPSYRHVYGVLLSEG